ncbi:hypothetical protein WA538_004105, partial [Blastocystis sp. DL]
WRATYISPHGVETYFAFVSDTEAVRVEDVLQQAIQSLNSLPFTGTIIPTSMEMTLSVELQDEPDVFYRISSQSPIPPNIHRWILRQSELPHLRYSNQLFLRDSFDINTTVTECDEDKESLLFDAMDPGLLSGPASFLQDEL